MPVFSKYGDVDKVKQDSKTVFEILNRQGATFIIDVLSEHTGETANMFTLSENDRALILKSLVNELEESLKERL